MKLDGRAKKIVEQIDEAKYCVQVQLTPVLGEIRL